MMASRAHERACRCDRHHPDSGCSRRPDLSERAQALETCEVRLAVVLELAFSGVVQRIDRDDPTRDLGVPVLQIAHEGRLGEPRAADQDDLRISQCAGDRRIEVDVVRAVSGSWLARLAVQLTILPFPITADPHRFRTLRVYVHDDCFVVIEPDDGVSMTHGESLLWLHTDGNALQRRAPGPKVNGSPSAHPRSQEEGEP